MAQGRVVVIPLLAVLLNAGIVRTQFCQEATSCCTCVSTPGCSWFYNASLPAPFCGETPYREMPVDPSLEARTPVSLYSSQYQILRNVPINVARRRLIQPQEFRVKQNVGSRVELNFKVYGVGRMLRMRVMDGTDNLVNVTATPVHLDDCPRGFSSNVRVGRGRRRLVLRCNRVVPRGTTMFKLYLDLLRCFSGPKQLKVAIVGGIMKQMKISVEANCNCPSGGNALSSSVNMDPTEETEAVGEVAERGESLGACDGEPPQDHQTMCLERNRVCVNSETGQTCSGQGQCLCGECLCNNINPNGTYMLAHMKYSGSSCECNDWSCPRDSSGLLCGGGRRGRCACGSCQCLPGWSGPACGFNLRDMSLCLPHPNGTICSGNGVCTLGRCVCNNYFAGTYCNRCPTCINPCNEHIFCVSCLLGDTNADAEQCHDRCSSERNQYMLVDDSTDTENELCIFRHATCNQQFSYSTDAAGVTTVYVSRTQHCDPE